MTKVDGLAVSENFLVYARSILLFILVSHPLLQPYSNNKNSVFVIQTSHVKHISLLSVSCPFQSIPTILGMFLLNYHPLDKKASKLIILFICEEKAIWVAAQVFMECFMCSIKENLY